MSDTGSAGDTYIDNSKHITVNGGTNSLSHADTVGVSTSVTNITAENVEVYVYGDYNPIWLYKPTVSEMHMVNTKEEALWSPTLDELPTYLHAAIMKEAGIAILYDGYVDLEHTESLKPEGATRYGEILGYDIYAREGETYENGRYRNGGILSPTEPVTQGWAIMQLYRALGKEIVCYDVTTEGRTSEEYNIDTSPLVQFLDMATMGVDLSNVISNVWATRTDMSAYLKLAVNDLLPTAEWENVLTVSEFCVLAKEMMYIYGEPVLTEQETYMLLEVYGRELPYGLSGQELEAVKYLLARGIVDVDLDWRTNLDFKTAATILMRIKDEDSRFTFKEFQLTTDLSLLAQGYHPVEVSSYRAPIEVLDSTAAYDTYTYYDYFVEMTSAVAFKSSPFLSLNYDNHAGALEGTYFNGTVSIGGKDFYHFKVNQNIREIENTLYVNTVIANEIPGRYQLSTPEGNSGGYWLYTGEDEVAGLSQNSTVSEWEFHALDGGTISFGAEFLDESRKKANLNSFDAQLSLYSESSYGFSLRVYTKSLGDITVKEQGITLLDVSTDPVNLPGGMTLKREAKSDNSSYTYFTVTGCDNKNTLAELFECASGTQDYTTFPAFSKNDDQYLVSIDYLKSLGVVWEFTQTGPDSYYLGIDIDGAGGDSVYTDVFIGKNSTASYAIRGSQLTIFPADRVLVYEGDASFYVDYSAVLGVQRVVGFSDGQGALSLTLKDDIPFLKYGVVYNPSNLFDSTTPAVESMHTVQVQGQGAYVTYVYAPITYLLANWIVVDNQLDGRVGVFSFYAAQDGVEADSANVAALESMVGLKMSSSGWLVNYTPMEPLAMTSVDVDGDTLKLTSATFPDVLYIEELDAYLLRPTYLTESDPGITYGKFVERTSSGAHLPLTSLVSKYEDLDDEGIKGVFMDWNYNIIDSTPGTAIHHHDELNYVCNISDWTGSFGFEEDNSRYTFVGNWNPGAAGIPGLIGYPATTSKDLTDRDGTIAYSGIARTKYAGRGIVIHTTPDGAAEDRSSLISYALIHASPHTAYIQTCGFDFEAVAGSPLAGAEMQPPQLTVEGAKAGFDWQAFYEALRMENADNWLSIAILAVLNILPRVLMFMFMVLMVLALIADVKPWKLFCDKVFDPYKVLTFGRQTVHTIKFKSVFIYSLIAFVVLGLFQNGLILDVLSWVARAVAGIFRR